MSGPSLKCLVVRSDTRNLSPLVEQALSGRVPAGERRVVAEGAYVLNTDATAAEVRDWLREVLDDGESALVVEFETWSGLGPVCAEWLMRRGH